MKKCLWLFLCALAIGAAVSIIRWIQRPGAEDNHVSFARSRTSGQLQTVGPRRKRTSVQPVPGSTTAGITGSVETGVRMDALPLSERIALVESCKTNSLPAVFQLFYKKHIRENSPSETDLMLRVIASRLQNSTDENTNDAIYKQITETLENPAETLEHKLPLLDLLGHAATEESLSILIGLVATVTDQELKTGIYKQIVAVSGSEWGGRFHQEFSPLLERAWPESFSDAVFSSALAIGIAKVGTPHCI